MQSLLKFPKLMKQALCLTLSASISLMGLVPMSASAQSVTCSSSTADRGTDARCGAIRIGGTPVSFPKLQWALLSDMPVAAAAGTSPRKSGSPEAIELGNRSALALGLKSSDIASMVSMFPSNVPYTFARYNPSDLTLRVDIFKLEKVIKDGQTRAGLYHANFGPAHGDYWKANRSYISPTAYSSGVAAGVNPFATFKEANTDNFKGITLNGAQVAMGHAMRLAGAPLGLMSIADVRMSSTTTTSKSFFTKKTTTTVYGHAKSKWLLAQPLNLLARSTTQAQASFCASDPTGTSCPMYETATAGVSIEEFEGGTLSNFEDQWQIDQQSKSGLSFIGALILGVIGSFAIIGVMGLAGIGAAAGGAVAGGAAAAPLGVLTTFGVQAGAFVGVTAAAAVAVEAALITATMVVLGGANLGSTIGGNDLGTMFSLGVVSAGAAAAPALSDYAGRINARVSPLTTADISTGRAALTGFNNTVMGNCAPGVFLSACGVASAGMIQRTDQYSEVNEIQFMRDNNGTVLKDANPLPTAGK